MSGRIIRRTPDGVATSDSPPTSSKIFEELLRLQSESTPDNPYTEAHAEELLARTSKLSCQHYLDRWFTNDSDMIRVKSTIRRLSMRQEPVTITGPSGTGKELLALALHGERPTAGQFDDQRRIGRFIPINCGAINIQLIHSIFFGHKKGAFTGANEDRKGLLVEAGHGTVFLDEIAELPLDVQAVLLRAIQESRITPVGSADEIPIYCRFVAATKEDIEKRVEQRLFREDLYARLYTFRVKITGLEYRPADIPIISGQLPGWTALVDKYAEDPQDPDRPEVNLLDLRTNPDVMLDIKRLNVRAIQAYILRMNVLGTYTC